jgi:hypothetical protein
MEEQNIYPPGSLVQVTNYSPFRGLNGTIQTVDTISDDHEEPFCFYLVALQGTHSINSTGQPETFQLTVGFLIFAVGVGEEGTTR